MGNTKYVPVHRSVVCLSESLKWIVEHPGIPGTKAKSATRNKSHTLEKRVAVVHTSTISMFSCS